MSSHKDAKQLLKLLNYILGRQPDEFGLVPDQDGFVKIKELLQAINEESGWKYVRRHHLDEILLSIPAPTIEIKSDSIRATNRERLVRLELVQSPPQFLYVCIRRKAHLVVLEKGVFPMGSAQVILSSNIEMALRMGKRKDSHPVLLTVHGQKMIIQGSTLRQLGEILYLVEKIPVGCFNSPSLAKQRPKTPKVESSPSPPLQSKSPRSFILSFSSDEQTKPHFRNKDRKKEVFWKQDRRLLKKLKNKMRIEP